MSDLDTDIGGTAATPRPQVLSPVDERALAEERQRLMDAAQTSDDNAIPTAPVYQTAPELVDEATPMTPPGSLANQVVHPAQRAAQATNPAAGAEDPELARSQAIEESGGYVPPGYKRSGAQAAQVAPQGQRQAAITQELTGSGPLGGTPETQPSALEQIATENATVWGESQQFLQDNLYDPITKSDVRDRAIIAVGKVNEVRLFRDRMAAAGFSDDQILQMPELMTAANIARRAMEDELTPDQRRTYVNEILPSIGPALHGADATITAIGSMAAMGVLAPEGLTSGLGEAGALGKGALAVLSGPEGALAQIGLETAARPLGAALGSAARSPAARAVFEEARAAFNAVRGKEPLNPAEVAPFLGNELTKNGGFTYSITHGNMAGKNAWAAGMYPEKSVILDHIASPDEIEHYIADNFDHLGLSGNNVGGWFSEGKTYLDVSRMFADRNQAIAAARAAGGEAIYHLGTGDEVHVLGAVPETAAEGIQRMGAGVPLFSEGVQQNVARPSAYDFVDKIKEAGATRVGDFEMKSETAPTSDGHYFLGPDGDLFRVPPGLSHDMTAAKALGLPYMDWAVTDNSALKQASEMGAVRVMSRPNVIAVQSGDPLNPMQTNKIYPFARSREIMWDVAGETDNGDFYKFKAAMEAIADRSIVQHPSGFSALLKLSDRGMPYGAGTQRTMNYTEFFNRQRAEGQTLDTDFLKMVGGAPGTSAAGYGTGTPTSLENVIKLARAGEGAKDWYPEAGEHFIRTMPKATDAAEKFSGVLSAQRSPAAAWGLQLRAQQAARELSLEGKFTEENFVKRFYELAHNQPEGDIKVSPGVSTRDAQAAADLAFRGTTGYPTALKIPTYSNAVSEGLFGTGANPVIDHHVASALGFTGNFSEMARYEAAVRYSQAMIEQAAKDLDWTPTQVQAALYHADKGLAARGLSVQDLHAPPEGALGAGEPGAGNAQGLHFDNLPSFPYDETVEGSIPHMVAVNKGRMAELQPLLDQMPEFPQPDVGPPRPAGGMTVTGGSNMRAFTLAPGHEYRWAGVATGAAGGATGAAQGNALNDYVNPPEEGQDQAEANKQAILRVAVGSLVGAALGAKAGDVASGFGLGAKGSSKASLPSTARREPITPRTINNMIFTKPEAEALLAQIDDGSLRAKIGVRLKDNWQRYWLPDAQQTIDGHTLQSAFINATRDEEGNADREIVTRLLNSQEPTIMASGFPLQKAGESLDAMRYASLLLHGATGVKILATNQVHALGDFISTPSEIGLSKGLHAVGDIAEKIGVPKSWGDFIERNAQDVTPRTMAEMAGASNGFLAGQAIGWSTAAEIMKGGLKDASQFTKDTLASFNLPQPREGLPPVVSQMAEATYRLMTATHIVGRTTADSMYAGARAYALAADPEIAKEFGAIKFYGALRGPDGRMIENNFENRLAAIQASHLAEQGGDSSPFGIADYAHARSAATIGMERSGLTDMIGNLLHGKPSPPGAGSEIKSTTPNAGMAVLQKAGQIIMPISHIPVNFMLQGLDYSTGGVAHALADAITGQGVESVANDLAHGTIGWSMMALGAHLHDRGALTGATPMTPEERNKLPDGWLPYSFKITTGDTTRYIPAPFLGKYGIPMTIGASINEETKMPDGVNFRNTGILAQEIGKAMLTHADMLGAAQTLNAVISGQGAEGAVEGLVGQIPFLGVVGDIEKYRGLAPREINSVFDRIKSEIPGLADTLPPQLTPLGVEKAATAGGPGVFVDPIRAREEHDDPVLEKVRELWPQGTGGPFPNIQRSAPGGGMGEESTRLSNEDIFQIALSRKRTAAELRTETASPQFAKLDTEHQRKAITDIVGQDMQRARDETIDPYSRNAPPVEGETHYIWSDHREQTPQDRLAAETAHRNVSAWLQGDMNAATKPPPWMFKTYNQTQMVNPRWEIQELRKKMVEEGARRTPPVQP